MIRPIILLVLLAGCLNGTFGQSNEVGSGHAVYFDGVNDYVDVGNVYDDLDFPFSITVWVFLGADMTGGPVLVSQDNANWYNGFWFLVQKDLLFIEYGDGQGTNHPAFRRGKSASVPDITGRWVHVTAVVNGVADIVLYLNGSDMGGQSGGNSNLPMDSDYPDDVAKIGYFFSNDREYWFNGVLDELRIYDKALSESEIRADMCRKIDQARQGLIGHWAFDEMSGNVLVDNSANNFDGIVHGAPQRRYSGAPIGDASVFKYPATGTLGLDQLQAENISDNPFGVHIYRVDAQPSQADGLPPDHHANPYYGFFVAAQEAGKTFDITLEDGSICSPFGRTDNSESQWTETSPQSITDRIELTISQQSSEIDVDLGDDIYLCGESAHQLSTNVIGDYEIAWSSGQTSPSVVVTETGEYWVEVKSECSVGRDTVRVTFEADPPAFSLGDDRYFCIDQPTLLTPVVNTGEFEFLWQDGSTNPTMLVTSYGWYSLQLSNACGSAIDSVHFMEGENLFVELGEDRIICDEDACHLSVNLDGDYDVTWNSGQTNPTITVTQSGEYKVEVKKNCKVARDSVRITLAKTPVPFTLGPDEETCAVPVKKLTPYSNPAGFDFTWQDGSHGNTFDVTEFGLVWVEVTSSCGSFRDSVTFEHFPIEETIIPNVITPNEDDKNQYFVVEDVLRGSQLFVFNRWGKKVFESGRYDNNWDGGGLPEGVYFYSMLHNCGVWKGIIHIVR